MAVPIPQIELNLKRRFDPANCTLNDFRSSDDSMRACLELAWVAARTELPVLILGESGTGKTMLARAIHNSSVRAGRPFVAFNAATLSDSLVDSQLFGHEKGAFTGAARQVRGKFELAHTGTLFIDEVTDMSRAGQAKILRTVEYGEFERLGSEQLQVADVRLLSATHLPKQHFLDGDHFRKDLYFRLSGLTLTVPALRTRHRDLPFLIAAEINFACKDLGKEVVGLSRRAAARLFSYEWPGNLRELNRVIQASVAICEGELLHRAELFLEKESSAQVPLEPDPLSSAVRPPPADLDDLTLRSAEKHHVLRVLESRRGNKRQTARALGISRSTLDRKLTQYGE